MQTRNNKYLLQFKDLRTLEIRQNHRKNIQNLFLFKA